MLILLIMGCALVGTVLLIGVCAPLSAVVIPPTPPKDDTPTVVIEETVQDDWEFSTNSTGEQIESTGETANSSEQRENAGEAANSSEQRENAGEAANSSEQSENTRNDAIKSNLREWIASCSVHVLRSQGKSDAEIKTELLRDFSLTEEQVDEIIATQ